MKLKETCSNCIRSIPMLVNKDLFCRDLGIVSPDYVCSRHRFTPEPRPFKELNFRCAQCEYFIPESSTAGPDSAGICQLFSIRRFNGEQKKACSKFMQKRKAGVS